MTSSDFFRAYTEGTSSLITLSPTLVDPAFVSVIRAVDGQETGLSVQPAEKKNRLQTGQDFHKQSALVQASLHLKHQPTGQLKRTRPLIHIQSANRVSFRPITKQVTCFHRPPRSEVRSSELTSTVTTVPALQTRPCCR